MFIVNKKIKKYIINPIWNAVYFHIGISLEIELKKKIFLVHSGLILSLHFTSNKTQYP